MKDSELLKKHIGSKFWKHIHKETLLPFSRIPDRISFLNNLWGRVTKMTYVPAPPRGYIVSHKQNLVARFIPTLTQEDYCVYLFCIKAIEDEIAQNRVIGTYGGWKLGGKIRKAEEFDFAVSMPDMSFNKFAWKEAWTDYQRRALNLYRDESHKSFAIFDIANFYDSIRLNRLETLVRESVGKDKTPFVSLLFYFLTHWGKRNLNYAGQSIGLPQDEVGDCSRVLANFYLQDYDRTLYRIATEKNSKYLRYADDQIIASFDEKTAKELMFRASKELVGMGLNLNASKAKFLSRDKFFIYWSFDIFKLLINKDDIKNIKKGFDIFEERLKEKADFRPEAVLKRLLSCNIKKLPKRDFQEIMGMAMEKKFIMSASNFYLSKIYSLLNKTEKEDLISFLNQLSDDVLFNEFHLRVLRFARENGLSSRKFLRVKNNLNNLALV